MGFRAEDFIENPHRHAPLHRGVSEWSPSARALSGTAPGASNSRSSDGRCRVVLERRWWSSTWGSPLTSPWSGCSGLRESRNAGPRTPNAPRRWRDRSATASSGYGGEVIHGGGSTLRSRRAGAPRAAQARPTRTRPPLARLERGADPAAEGLELRRPRGERREPIGFAAAADAADPVSRLSERSFHRFIHSASP